MGKRLKVAGPNRRKLTKHSSLGEWKNM